MPNKLFKSVLIIFSFLFFLSGCDSFNGAEIRREHTAEYTQQLAQKTNDILIRYQPLDMNDCIQIALDNNLLLKSTEIQQRIALLEKKVSFANFLPAVSLNYQKIWWDPQPQIKFGASGFPMHDKDVSEITWNIQLSIFNPVTWFLYSMHTRGYEIAELVTDYTRQAIAMEVTVGYFQCLSLEKMLTAVESQVEAAQALENELDALLEEGMVPNWQVEQGRVLVLARQTELHQIQTSLNQAKAELLADMGLDPGSDVTLEMQMPLKAPEGPLEELITEALLRHPSMGIADRQVAIEKEKIRAAVMAFIPNLFGYANRVDTSDSHQVFTNYWLGGLSAAITLFDGFANVNYYRTAKELHQESRIRREQATLALMIQIIRASDHVQLAKEQTALAEQVNKTTIKHLDEIRKKYEQGLVQTSDMLAMTAEADKSRIQFLQAQLQYQTSIALLNNVLGKTETIFGESADEAK